MARSLQFSPGSQVSIRQQQMLSSSAATSSPLSFSRGLIPIQRQGCPSSSIAAQLVPWLSTNKQAAKKGEPQPTSLNGSSRGVHSGPGKSARTPQAVAEGRVSHPDTLSTPSLLPRVSSPSTPLSYSEIIQLIDVQRPYYALFDMAQLGDATVGGYFLKESTRHEETRDPISGSELGRHCAIMGSVACATANPLKEKHYYLAFGARFQRIEGNGDGQPLEADDKAAKLMPASLALEGGGLFKGVAECTLFRRGMAKAFINIFHWRQTGAFELYGRFEVTYAVFTQEAFLKTVPSLPNGHDDSTEIPTAILAGDDGMPSVNPYLDPVSIVETPELHTSDTRSGVLRFTDASTAAGHFPHLPALPVSVLGSNAFKCVSFFEGVDNYRMKSCKLKFGKLAWLGQTVWLCATKTGDKSYRIIFKVDREQMGSLEVELDM